MRARVMLLVAVIAAGSLSGCQEKDEGASPTGPTSTSVSFPPTAPAQPEPQQLPIGKSVLALHTGTSYGSPEGFAPQVIVRLSAEGWVSTHRSGDAFDVSQPLPEQDAPLVVVAFMVPTGTSADAVRQTVTAQAETAGATVKPDGHFTLAVTGGDGPLIASRDGGIALDAVPSGYSRITITDSAAGPSAVVFWVPDATYRDQAEQAAHTMSVVTEQE